MREKLDKLFRGEEIALKEQFFRLILVVGLLVSVIAIFAGLVLENAFANAIPLCVLVCVILAASVATFKYHKIDFAAALFGVLIICVIFPLMFFVSGGIHGGSAVWFVLGLLYLFLMFEGKKLFVFLAVAIVVDIYLPIIMAI